MFGSELIALAAQRQTLRQKHEKNKMTEKVLTGHFEGVGSAPSSRGGEELKLDHGRVWTYFSTSIGEVEPLQQMLAPHLRTSG